MPRSPDSIFPVAQQHASVAQWIERLPPEQKAEGSIPFRGTSKKVPQSLRNLFLYLFPAHDLTALRPAALLPSRPAARLR